MRLEGKSAVVTGAGRGIGRAIAGKFLQEGARVFICDLARDRLEDAREELASLGTVRGEVVDVANAFAFLASDEASFITGTELVVDGGQICQE